MLEAGAKGTEVAATLGVHADTLYNRCAQVHGMTFSDYSAKRKAKGDYDLRLVQHKKAKDGNTMMLIWLGKQRLEQREHANEDRLPPNDQVLTMLLEEIKMLRSKVNNNAIESQANPVVPGIE